MAHSITAHGKTFHFGRHAPKTKPRWHFRNYADLKALPSPPTVEDWSAAAATGLADIMENDTLGCCVISGGGHQICVWTGNAGSLFTYSDAQIISDYSAIGGYVPGDPSTDNGCDEQTAFSYWGATGFANGAKLAGWMGVDATKPALLQQSIYLFESNFFGVALPDAWVNPMPSASGFVWDVAGPPNPQQGHAFVAVGYTADGVVIDTWGMLGLVTWAALAKYMVASAGGEAYVLVSQAQLASAQAKAPNGFDWTSLVADFDSLGGNLPLPGPSPGPSPNPTPNPNPPSTPDVEITVASKTVHAPGWMMTAGGSKPHPNTITVNVGQKTIIAPPGWVQQ